MSFYPHPALQDFIKKTPAREFEEGQVICDPKKGPPAGLKGRYIALMHEGVALGSNRIMDKDFFPRIAEAQRKNLELNHTVAGDGMWFCLEALDCPNIFTYKALSPCRVSFHSVEWLQQEAPRELLFSAAGEASCLALLLVTARMFEKLSPRIRVLNTLTDVRYVSKVPEVRLSQDDLASLTGLGRTRTNQVLARLKKEGLLTIEYKQIILPDYKELMKAMTE